MKPAQFFCVKTENKRESGRTTLGCDRRPTVAASCFYKLSCANLLRCMPIHISPLCKLVFHTKEHHAIKKVVPSIDSMSEVLAATVSNNLSLDAFFGGELMVTSWNLSVFIE